MRPELEGVMVWGEEVAESTSGERRRIHLLSERRIIGNPLGGNAFREMVPWGNGNAAIQAL